MKRKNTQKSIVSITMAIASLLAPLNAQEELSDADRIAILTDLEKIEEASNSRVDGLYRRAIADYRSAISSDAETFKLYLNCYEKVNFTEKHLKSSDFREWKKKNEDKLKSSSFRMALRQQLAWLLISIETASKGGDVTEMGNRAVSHLNTIFENAEAIKGHQQILKQNVLGSEFARAYDLNIKIDGWPKSALDIQNIYEKLVMPPLRDSGQIEALRTAWDRKILHLGTAIEAWTENKGERIGTKDALKTPQMEVFLAETRPQLIWDKEKDCFESGAERTAALNMLNHLKVCTNHKDLPRWIEEFSAYVALPEVVSEEISEE
ncbi:hypothetical protein OAI07_00685 [Akkermansiaceae bacterium]|nr:hypothetical protein [Akkermansiaceae bacterium]